MKIKNLKVIWLLIIFSVFLTQCRPVHPSNEPTITPQSSPFPVTPIPPTQTATLPATPTRTPRPSQTPSWTPVATLPPDQAQSLLAELVRTNGGCIYPCWWGIVPGETTWIEAREFLQPLTSSTKASRDGNSYGLIFPNPIEEATGDISAGFTIEGGIVTMIQTRNRKNIFVMLEEFGKPDQIWLNSIYSGLPSYALYEIVLFYSEKGMMAMYEGEAIYSETESLINICLTDTLFEPFLPVWLWSPESKLTYRELESQYLIAPQSSSDAFFVSLEESTDIDVDTFYEIYSDPSNKSTCFEAVERTLMTPEPTP